MAWAGLITRLVLGEVSGLPAVGVEEEVVVWCGCDVRETNQRKVTTPTQPQPNHTRLRTVAAVGEVLLEGCARVGAAVRKQQHRVVQQRERDGAQQLLGRVCLQELVQWRRARRDTASRGRRRG